MDLFSKDKKLPISYDVFHLFGWQYVDYVRYKNLCLAIRSAIITAEFDNTADERTIEQANRRIEDAVKYFLDWLRALTALNLLIQYDIAGALYSRNWSKEKTSPAVVRMTKAKQSSSSTRRTRAILAST